MSSTEHPAGSDEPVAAEGTGPDPGNATPAGLVDRDHSEAAARGVRQLTADRFSIADSIGGVRGLIESVAPGLVFVVTFVLTRDLTPALIASVAVAVVATIARLIGRTPVTQAVGGLAGVAIGAVWAWRSGEASDFFAWGLLVNAGFAVGVLASILLRWPGIGVLVALLTRQDNRWCTDRALRRRNVRASWL